MNLRRGFLFGAVASLGVALVILPAVAGSETSPRIEAVNSTGIYSEQVHYWNPSHAAIGEGASVTLANPTAVAHGVRWVGGPALPACSAAVPVGTTASAAGKEWSGDCTFSASGTYTFYCTVHGSEMTGVITVAPVGAPIVTQPPAGSGSTGPAGTGGPALSAEPQQHAGVSPLAGSAASAIKLAFSQRGRLVHGSVGVSAAGAHGRLEVDLLARSVALARDARSVRVGRFVRSSLTAGKLSFAVALSAKARAALERRGHLALTVKVMLAPAHGSPVTIKRAVLMRP